MLDIAKIRAVLDEASKWDMEYKAFGTEVHLHILRPVLPLEELETWEEQAKLSVPEDYRAYLTQLGNGGAGPAYGLPPFRPPDAELLRRPSIYSADQKEAYQNMRRRVIHWDDTEDWDLYLEYFPDTPGRLDPDWVEAHREEWIAAMDSFWDQEVEDPLLYNGQMFLANEGCTANLYLIFNGTCRGFVHHCDIEMVTDYFSEMPETFEAYRRKYLKRDFAAYYMAYVNKTEDFLRNIPAEERRRAAWERAQVRDFLSAMEAQDWQGIRKLLAAMGDSHELSKKARSFFHQYEKAVMEKFPGDRTVWRFFDGAFGSWNSYGYPREPIGFREDGGRWVNPRQSFEAFIRTFYDD